MVFKKLIIAFLFIWLACAASSYIPPPETRPLSLDLVREFSIKDSELKKLQYYLEKPVVLQGGYTEKEREIRDDHGMDLKKTKIKETVNFPFTLPGVVLRITREPTFLIFNKVMKMHVSFDTTNTEFLTFSPNNDGHFRLQTSGDNIVYYGNNRYRCVEGCNNNRLLFDVRIFEELIEKTRYVPGRIYKE